MQKHRQTIQMVKPTKVHNVIVRRLLKCGHVERRLLKRGSESGDRNGSANHIPNNREPAWNKYAYSQVYYEFMLQRELNRVLEKVDYSWGL
jgi:hypothetical protein